MGISQIYLYYPLIIQGTSNLWNF